MPEKKPIAKKKNARGRPTAFSRESADYICKRLSAGETLRAICRDDVIPSESVVRGWVISDVCGFSAQYARAREAGCYAMVDEALEIADDTSSDAALGQAAVQRSKLRVDTRRWFASKILWRVFGARPEDEDRSGKALEEGMTLRVVRADPPKRGDDSADD